MSTVRAQMSIPKDSGLPEDVVVNTFHFAASDPPTTTELDNIRDALSAFYSAVDVAWGSVSLTSFMSRNLTGPATLKYYNLADAVPRVPLRTDSISMTFPTTDNGLPDEVALCLSFQAAQVSGQDPKNRRGRVYIGPINGSANTSGGAPTSQLIARLVAAGDNLRDDPNTVWGVYSPTLQQFFTVANGWVDNAFDTQRRRGIAATARTLW